MKELESHPTPLTDAAEYWTVNGADDVQVVDSFLVRDLLGSALTTEALQ